ncbi:hypothetical protein Pla52o_48400 [Novipirellula galeiformis]|uniref:Uncharacterized protein n=1 Tax=Novipirellula galeiformis TaxID=2528004 RepID=A0A5C6CA09_9BACT|nr:hypothetical protein Pla52o_48400 [Novipirellula galeiformis]
MQMFLHADANFGTQFFIDILYPLALADRIIDQAHIAQSGQPLGERLVSRFCFSVVRMTTGSDDRRQRPGSPFGDIHIGRYGESRAAFEDHIFDPVIIMFDSAGDPWIERRTRRLVAKGLANP